MSRGLEFVEGGSVLLLDGSRPCGRCGPNDRPKSDLGSVNEVCGIAGYSLSGASRVDQTLATQTLLAAISMGSMRSATRTARRAPDGRAQAAAVPAPCSTGWRSRATRSRLIHVRDYTKGHPSLTANNHRSAMERSSASTTDHRQRRGYPRRPRVRARGARHDCGLRGHLRPGGRRLQPPRRLEELHGSMAAAWLDDRDEETSSSPAGSVARSGSARARTSSSSPPPEGASSSSSATPASARGSGSSARGRSWRSRTAQSGGPTPSSPTRASSRATSSSPCGHRGRSLGAGTPGRDRDRGHSTLAVQRSSTAERNAPHPPRPRRRAGRPAIPRGAWGSPRPAPVASPRGSARASSLRAPAARRRRAPLRRSSRPWTSKPAAWSARERAEPVPVEGRRRQLAPALVHPSVRRPPEPAEQPKLPGSFAGGEAPRTSPARRLAAFQEPKRSTAVCGWSGAWGPQRARAWSASGPALRAGGELSQDAGVGRSGARSPSAAV